MTSEGFIAELSRVGNSDMLTLQGEIDLVSAPDLESALEDLGPEITLDMRKVEFMDSSGIAVLVRAHRIGNRIKVLASPAVGRILQVTGLDQTFQVSLDGAEPGDRSP